MLYNHKITSDMYSIGGSDRRITLFENLFPLDNGVTYNAYLIDDEKTTVIDTVDHTVSRRYLESIQEILGTRLLDYLVITHMEPDHCAVIEDVVLKYPEVKLVGNTKTFKMIEQFYNRDLKANYMEVQENSVLHLGRHSLQFVMAPMVHWPEVMLAYEATEQILFSADAFGTFVGYNGNIFSDEVDYKGLYLDEARRYYANIVGKFGAQVQPVLEKASGLEIKMICPLHGPVLKKEAIDLLMDKYRHWSSYQPEKTGVVLAYASMYGNTENAVQVIAGKLADRGVKDIRIFDVSKTHPSYIIAEIFKYSHLVLGAPTYNMNLYYTMKTLLHDMIGLNVQKRKVALVGNGSWGPTSHKLMRDMIEEMKDMELLGEPLVIRSALKESQLQEVDALVDAVYNSL